MQTRAEQIRRSNEVHSARVAARAQSEQADAQKRQAAAAGIRATAETRQADAFEQIADSLEALVKWVTTPPYDPLAALADLAECEKIADHDFTPDGRSRRCAAGIGGGEVCGEYFSAHLRGTAP